MEIISKEGLLYVLGVKFGKRNWRKSWGVLFKPSSKGVGRLELYSVLNTNAVTNQKKWGRLKTPESKTVPLSDCLSVTAAPTESCPDGCTAFYLKTRLCIYTLASPPQQNWLSSLCLLVFKRDSEDSDLGSSETGTGVIMKNNDLYSSWTTEPKRPPNSYQVTVQSTEASRRCNLSGTYLVTAEPEAVTLLTCNSGRVLYSWPYRQLYHIKKVEGGFSFKVRRGCHSGDDVFIFLSTRAPAILQMISEQRSVQMSTSVQPLNANRRSSCDPSPNVVQMVSHPPAVHAPAGDPTETEQESDHLYSYVNRRSPASIRQLSLLTPSISTSREAVGDESEDDDDDDDDDECDYLEGLRLANPTDESIYCNVSRTAAAPPRGEASECVYAAVKIAKSAPEPQVRTFPSPLLPPLPQLPPQPVSYPLYPKPRYQLQLPVNNLIQPAPGAQAQAADDIKEMEEAISSSTQVTPTELPGSFKYRLAEIISKDLAKSQPDPVSSLSSSTFPL